MLKLIPELQTPNSPSGLFTLHFLGHNLHFDKISSAFSILILNSFLDKDKYGYGGVESSLQDILSGKNGRRVVEVDVAGL